MLLPDLTLPLRVGRDKSIRAIECADETALQFLTVSQNPGPELNTGEDPKPETLYRSLVRSQKLSTEEERMSMGIKFLPAIRN